MGYGTSRELGMTKTKKNDDASVSSVLASLKAPLEFKLPENYHLYDSPFIVAPPEYVSGARRGAKVYRLDDEFAYSVDPQTHLVCGIDEVGRGPLMGDVVASCVVLDPNNPIEGLTDSKALSESARDELYVEILEKAKFCSVGRASAQEIDAFNILNATFLAMTRAYLAIATKCDLILIDGNKVPNGISDEAEAVVKGDLRVAEISAASIVAKVTRDHDLYELDKLYPDYGFANHKGYPTKAHLEAIKNLPLLDCYRRSFGPVAAIARERGEISDDIVY